MPRLAKLGIVSIIYGAWALAYPGEHFQVRDLTERADVIAVVDISRIDDAGTTTITVDGQSLAANLHRADVHTQRCIKGACPSQFSLDFFTPEQFVGYPGIGLGHQIVFLKRRNSGYEFADRHYPSLPAASGPASGTESDPLRAVIAELGRVLSSPAATQAQKWAVLARAPGIPNVEPFKLSLQAGLDAADNSDLKYRIQAELIARDDLPQLRSSVDLLLTNALTSEQRQTFLLTIANSVKNPKALPEISRLLLSSDPVSRRAAAEVLWHIASPNPIPDLARILEDPDQEVRFYAVRGLSDIANEPGWGGPGESELQERQQEYLAHWRNWVESPTK
jgi:HEAT repeats